MSSKSVVAKVAQPYAEALLELAKETSCIDNCNKDSNVILDTLKTSKDLKASLSNPLITSSTKKDILKNIFSDQLTETFMSFLMVLVDRRRIDVVEVIVEKYLELAYKTSAVTIAKVFTAVPFSPEQCDLLIDKLKSMTGAQEIKLIITVDTELIGGFSVQVGSKVIDTSLKGQLNQMASYLEGDS
uniref:ATP synthase CF1 delta subunit n=1 Tax=Madagascaria erythrocladioides TaxID=753684 RepID=UPI001FCDA30D|nr:ATP synthase CF1 delta subunit [Madagascaria erythrocladioides]UNJ16544.1 ATP synthase CF1 delta subunit [Madagascaria erythrocladioides]